MWVKQGVASSFGEQVAGSESRGRFVQVEVEKLLDEVEAGAAPGPLLIRKAVAAAIVVLLKLLRERNYFFKFFSCGRVV